MNVISSRAKTLLNILQAGWLLTPPYRRADGKKTFRCQSRQNYKHTYIRSEVSKVNVGARPPSREGLLSPPCASAAISHAHVAG